MKIPTDQDTYSPYIVVPTSKALLLEMLKQIAVEHPDCLLLVGYVGDDECCHALKAEDLREG